MEVDPDEILDDCPRVIARVIAKGKRTKRRRPPSPFLGGIATSTCSSSAGGAGEQDGDDAAAAAVTTSVESTTFSSTEEEEDMAHCLILLAQGSRGKLPDVSAVTTKSGIYVYECKTCNRVFPSFQALGGHRASHKKPKLLPLPAMMEPAIPALVVPDFDEEERQFCKTALLPDPAPLRFPGKGPTTNIAAGNKQKVHECSICGLEFRSGQALGGHMRRHRSAPTGSNHAIPANSDAINFGNSLVSDDKPSRNILPLDLNLPAPEDDHIGSKFAFGSTQQQQILFSGPVLVDCHY